MSGSGNESWKIFIAPLNWGLGHATRMLPLIRSFLTDNHKVYIGAIGRSLELLKEEVPQALFLDFPPYPIKYSRSGYFVTRFMLVTFPNMLLAMLREKYFLKKYHRKIQFDLIISDNRFACNLPDVKSILISHQLRYELPRPIYRWSKLPEYFNYLFFRKFDQIIVPDEEVPESLTGLLSHKLNYLPGQSLYYAGIISDLRITRENCGAPIDYFIILSGPEPQRTLFENLILEQVYQLDGKIVVVLGRPEKRYIIRVGNAIIHTYMDRHTISSYMHRAEFIIARPGYTTVMEMVELEKKGFFIPTPGQIEQEYLAGYYLNQGWCLSVPQKNLNLNENLNRAKSFPGFPKTFRKTGVNVNELYSQLKKMISE